MKHFFDWILAHLVTHEAPAYPSSLEAIAVATRVGNKWSNGLSKWRVVIQLRAPKADYDAVYTIQWVSKNPPCVSDIVQHYATRPEDFRFLNFFPNLKKQPNLPSGC